MRCQTLSGAFSCMKKTFTDQFFAFIVFSASSGWVSHFDSSFTSLPFSPSLTELQPFFSLSSHPPFFTEDGNPIKLYEKIIACKVRYPPYFEPAAKDLLKSLLTADLTKRFGNLHRGSKDIFGHLWFAEVDWDRLYRREIPAPYLPTVTADGDASQ